MRKPKLRPPLPLVFLVLGVLVALAVFFLGGPRDPNTWIAALAAALPIVLLGAGLGALKAWRGRKRGAALVQGLAKQHDAVVRAAAPERRRSLEELRDHWQTALRLLRDSAVDEYALPWIALIGEPGSGKSTTLRNSGLDFPLGEGRLQGIGGTRNCDFWFANDAVVLDTAGRFTIAESEAQDRAEWEEFLRLLRKARPRFPVNGVVLAVPSTSLLGDPPEVQAKKAGQIREKIGGLQRVFGLRLPVYLLVTKCDKVPGFAEFFHGLPREVEGQAVGWSNPASLDALYDPKGFGAAFDALLERLREIQPRALHDQFGTSDVEGAFVFLRELEAIRAGLQRCVETIFKGSVYEESPFFRGFYFSSGLQEKSITHAVFERLLRDHSRVALRLAGGEEKGEEGHRAFFVLGFYQDRVFPERAVARPSLRTQGRRRRLERAAWAAAAVAASVGLAWSGLTFAAEQGRLQSLRDALEAVDHEVRRDLWGPAPAYASIAEARADAFALFRADEARIAAQREASPALRATKGFSSLVEDDSSGTTDVAGFLAYAFLEQWIPMELRRRLRAFEEEARGTHLDERSSRDALLGKVLALFEASRLLDKNPRSGGDARWTPEGAVELFADALRDPEAAARDPVAEETAHRKRLARLARLVRVRRGLGREGGARAEPHSEIVGVVEGFLARVLADSGTYGDLLALAESFGSGGEEDTEAMLRRAVLQDRVRARLANAALARGGEFLDFRGTPNAEGVHRLRQLLERLASDEEHRRAIEEIALGVHDALRVALEGEAIASRSERLDPRSGRPGRRHDALGKIDTLVRSEHVLTTVLNAKYDRVRKVLVEWKEIGEAMASRYEKDAPLLELAKRLKEGAERLEPWFASARLADIEGLFAGEIRTRLAALPEQLPPDVAGALLSETFASHPIVAGIEGVFADAQGKDPGSAPVWGRARVFLDDLLRDLRGEARFRFSSRWEEAVRRPFERLSGKHPFGGGAREEARASEVGAFLASLQEMRGEFGEAFRTLLSGKSLGFAPEGERALREFLRSVEDLRSLLLRDPSGRDASLGRFQVRVLPGEGGELQNYDPRIDGRRILGLPRPEVRWNPGDLGDEVTLDFTPPAGRPEIAPRRHPQAWWPFRLLFPAGGTPAPAGAAPPRGTVRLDFGGGVVLALEVEAFEVSRGERDRRPFPDSLPRECPALSEAAPP